MIEGAVTTDREAVIELRVRGTDRREITVIAVIDTGYTDYLMLPSSMVRTLGLPFLGPVEYTLANNSAVVLNLFACDVWWHNRWAHVAAADGAGGALVGMALMSGSELRIVVREGGGVNLLPLA